MNQHADPSKNDQKELSPLDPDHEQKEDHSHSMIHSVITILPSSPDIEPVNPFSWWTKFNADTRIHQEMGYGAMNHPLISMVIGLPVSKVLPQGGIGVCVGGNMKDAKQVRDDFLRVVGHDYPICVVTSMSNMPFDTSKNDMLFQ